MIKDSKDGAANIDGAASVAPRSLSTILLSDSGQKKRWYVVNTLPNMESRAKINLEERIRFNSQFQEYFGDILVPQEQVVELVRGKKKQVSKKFLPNYILVQLELNQDSWHLVCETPKITGFVGDSREPVPLTQDELEALARQMDGTGSKTRVSSTFEHGDAVKVSEGPFAEFNGTVEEVLPEKGKIRVLISIFGRNTPVLLDFNQVERA